MATEADLLSVLWRIGPATPSALRAELGVPARSLNRLVAAAGEQVHAIGRARAVRYARTRTVEGVGRSMPAFRLGEDGSVSPDGAMWLLAGGRTSWERDGATELFVGLPPELADMAPQGFLGRAFPALHPDIHLPSSIGDWNDDHRIAALARRGEDCVGNLVVGEESFRRLVVREPVPVSPSAYPALAERAASDPAGSSAGGERPKFGAFDGARHLLVKFAPPGNTGPARRWRDLLVCEAMALETVAEAGRPAARARWVDVEGWRFLEVERFDRVGARGRRAAISLSAVVHEYLGAPTTWTEAAPMLAMAPFRLSPADGASLCWLDAFGQLAGNTDRHLGNVSFLAGPGRELRLAPAYDVVPMVLAPTGLVVTHREFTPAPPAATALDVWPDAARWAVRYWARVEEEGALEDAVRRFAADAGNAVRAALSRITGRAAQP